MLMRWWFYLFIWSLLKQAAGSWKATCAALVVFFPETHLSPVWLKLMVSALAALGSILPNPCGGNYGDGRIISAQLNSPEMFFCGYTGVNWVWVWTCHMMKGKQYSVGAD